MSRIFQCVGIFWLAATGLRAEAVDSWHYRADLIAVGTLELSSYYLWFDGVHVNGTISIDGVLWGNARPGDKLIYRNVVRCSLWDAIPLGEGLRCDYRQLWADWSNEKRRIKQRGIWELLKGPGQIYGDRWDRTSVLRLSNKEHILEVLKERRAQSLPR